MKIQNLKFKSQNFGISLREFSSSAERRRFLEDTLEISLTNISNFSFSEEQIQGRNIENLIGTTQVPLGVAGPLTVNSKEYFIPLATTEGALVASVSRGSKAITQAGGASSFSQLIGMTRGPVFKVSGVKQGFEAEKWIKIHFEELKKEAQSSSKHLKLLNYDFALAGRNLFVRFYYDCSKAMGMNMVTIATAKIVKIIEEKTKISCISLAGNYDIDKKSAWLNFINGRGRKVWSEVILTKKIVKETLKTTPEKIAEVVFRKCLTGSALSGSLGYNSHFANIAAALFIATGQDPAHVTEASLGVSSAEVLENGDLYFSVYLPAVEIGTIGGGTRLPTQFEALKILNLEVDSVEEFSHCLGGAVLAGELSLIASLAEDSLVCAHKELGRGGNRW